MKNKILTAYHKKTCFFSWIKYEINIVSNPNDLVKNIGRINFLLSLKFHFLPLDFENNKLKTHSAKITHLYLLFTRLCLLIKTCLLVYHFPRLQFVDYCHVIYINKKIVNRECFIV